jgi:putative membrane protein
MEDTTVKTVEKKSPFAKLIVVVSIVIPVVVAILFKVKITGYDFRFLPPIYATINGITAACLISALIAIKNGKQKLHERFMTTCMVLSAAFLALYVLYHMTTPSTSFGGTDTIKYIYFFILITHILLSIGVVPLVLFSYLHAWQGNFVRHRKLAKIAFPIWLYVAVTGVIVYLMISPYYS